MAQSIISQEVRDEIGDYIRNAVEPKILFQIVDLNRKNTSLPNPPLFIMSGGQVLNKFFPYFPELKTPDFDIKLTIPYDAPFNEPQLSSYRDQTGVFLSKIINSYMMSINLYSKINAKFGINLQPTEISKHGPLLTVIYKFTDKTGGLYSMPLLDLYLANPSQTLNFESFTQRRFRSLLSKGNIGHNKYYIPYTLINGVPYAGLGYMIWDTQRLINESIINGSDKLTRYVKKYYAIINGLNRPLNELSCVSMKDYIKKCQRDTATCGGNILQLIQQAISSGLLNRQDIIQFREQLGDEYLCEYITKSLSMVATPSSSIMRIPTVTRGHSVTGSTVRSISPVVTVRTIPVGVFPVSPGSPRSPATEMSPVM